MPARELALVLPAFDEASRIGAVIAEWDETLTALGVDYEIHVYDDGSRDATPEVLAACAGRLPRLRVTRQANRGHGPTILRGYREVRAQWIAQADADGEIPAASFAALWERRRAADLVLGQRQGRPQRAARRAVSAVARAAVRVRGGGTAADVNVPFRLLRAARWAPLLAELPADLFAPNVALTALALARGWRVVEVPVPHVTRRDDAGTLVSGRLARGAARSLIETLALLYRGGGGA
jgi:glycosyltransferase involved in cell wall biosynthesis